MTDQTAPPTGVHAAPELTGWTVHLGTVPVAIRAAAPEWTNEEQRLLHDLAGAFAFGLRQISTTWNAAHVDAREPAGYVLDLRSTSSAGQEMPLWVESQPASTGPAGLVAHATVHVVVDGLAAAADADINSVRDLMASAVGDIIRGAGVGDDHARLVEDAWAAAPPTLAVKILTTPTTRNDLPAPMRLDAALVSQVDRLVAEAVRAAGIESGQYRGQDAKDLDRTVLAPAALDVLNARLATHAMDDLVRRGMVELERVLAERDQTLRDLEQSAALLNIDWDPVKTYEEKQNEYLLLRRCGEAAVEAALRTAPSGTRPVDAVAWGEILAAARAYLDATMRSESVHHQVSPLLVEITESYEIRTVPDVEGPASTGAAGSGRVYDLEMSNYAAARSAHRLLPEPPEGAPSSGALIDHAVDAAMLLSYGATGTDVISVLFALAQWPLAEADPDAVSVNADDVVEYLTDQLVIGQADDGRSRIHAALGLLTSTSAALAAADWKPWHARSRQKRLLIQPLPTLSDGSVVVAPHLCLGSSSVYRGYLGQGQLPWSDPPAPGPVAHALDRARDARNLALETEVVDLLRSGGWTVIERVKETKPDRLGVPALSGEVDAVAGRPGTGTIWLLEVKDPADTFVVPEIRRALDRFFVDQKKPCYVTMLQRKQADLAPHAEAIAAALGLPARLDGAYVVRPMFVTRRPVPAAFVSGSPPFTTVPELLRTLSADSSD